MTYQHGCFGDGGHLGCLHHVETVDEYSKGIFYSVATTNRPVAAVNHPIIQSRLGELSSSNIAGNNHGLLQDVLAVRAFINCTQTACVHLIKALTANTSCNSQ